MPPRALRRGVVDGAKVEATRQTAAHVVGDPSRRRAATAEGTLAEKGLVGRVVTRTDGLVVVFPTPVRGLLVRSMETKRALAAPHVLGKVRRVLTDALVRPMVAAPGRVRADGGVAVPPGVGTLRPALVTAGPGTGGAVRPPSREDAVAMRRLASAGLPVLITGAGVRGETAARNVETWAKGDPARRGLSRPSQVRPTPETSETDAIAGAAAP